MVLALAAAAPRPWEAVLHAPPEVAAAVLALPPVAEAAPAAPSEAAERAGPWAAAVSVVRRPPVEAPHAAAEAVRPVAVAELSAWPEPED